MEKTKVGVIYGGDSPEHEVSKMTAKSILENIDRDRFEVREIFIDKNGKFDEALLKNIDITFLVVHGENYEDGKFQRYLDKLGIKYTGSGIRASEINMDKVLQKRLFQQAGLKVANYVKIISNQPIEQINYKVKTSIGYPVIVKPTNTGSSLGISRVENEPGLAAAIFNAKKIHDQIIIEKFIENKRELEISILGNNKLLVSNPGEVLAHDKIYSYEAKYFKPFVTTDEPKNLPSDIAKKAKSWAKKAYRATDCRGYARVDLFLTSSKELYINEINTLPGFTEISMFPRMMLKSGISYQDLITKIIELGLETDVANKKNQ